MERKLTMFSRAAIIAAAAIFVQACTAGKGGPTKVPVSSEPVPVRVTGLEKSSAAGVITVSGQIASEDETSLSFKVPGVVSDVYVKEGDRVRRNQVLARLDQTEINAVVAQARLSLEKANRDLERVANLYRDSVATLEQHQNAATAYAIAKEELESAEFNRSHAEIRAVADGFVLRRFVNAGQVVGTGDPVVRTNQSGAGNWVLRAGLSDKEWASLRLGENVAIEVEAYPGSSLPGVVIRKSGAADPATGTFTVEIRIDGAGRQLATGMFATATIRTSQPVAYWAVPYEAVLDASGKEAFVFITNDSATAIRRRVLVHSFDGSAVKVESGLEDARTLIVAGSAYLSDGRSITILR